MIIIHAWKVPTLLLLLLLLQHLVKGEFCNTYTGSRIAGFYAQNVRYLFIGLSRKMPEGGESDGRNKTGERWMVDRFRGGGCNRGRGLDHACACRIRHVTGLYVHVTDAQFLSVASPRSQDSDLESSCSYPFLCLYYTSTLVSIRFSLISVIDTPDRIYVLSRERLREKR